MLRQYENSIDDKRQFTALVKDIFPEEAKNINLILMAYNMGIAQDIQKANLLNNTFAFRYVKQLMDDYGISRVNADWIVSVWCSCYGNKVLGKACDISVQKQGGGPAIKDNKSSSGKSYGELYYPVKMVYYVDDDVYFLSGDGNHRTLTAMLVGAKYIRAKVTNGHCDAKKRKNTFVVKSLN